ncbi:MAG: hypothetical protein ACJ71W_23350 [Terriglobales bacterium]
MSPQQPVRQVEDALEPEESGQGRSTIKFPYLDLDDAVEVAKAIHTAGGTSCQKDQLAAQLEQSATGGGFNLRLITAKLFGFVSYDRGTVSLTSLGQKISDPEKQKSARVEAFLAIPLYKAIYEQFKGTTLPPNAGLESAMETLGVAPKQKDKARQVFQRSATQAGFFAYGNNRLVPPTIKASGEPEKPKDDPGGSNPEDDDKKDKGKKLDPFIQGLLAQLPPAKTPWPIEARKKWLQLAASVFDVMYSAKDGDSGELSITVNKFSAT